MTATGDSLLFRGTGCPIGAAALFRPAPEVDEDPDEDEEEDENGGYEEPDELEEENGEEDEDEEETWQVAILLDFSFGTCLDLRRFSGSPGSRTA